MATAWLNASYALSRFPVSYHEARLSFGAARLEEWYAQLADLGTRDVYLRTQYIDHTFILTSAGSALCGAAVGFTPVPGRPHWAAACAFRPVIGIAVKNSPSAD
jgi:hypothetical protein